MITQIVNGLARQISRSRIYALINLLGLGIGLAACLMIFLFIADELSYDRHHEHASGTFRLLRHNPATGRDLVMHAGVMHDYLIDQLHGVEAMARLLKPPAVTVSREDLVLTETGLIAADADILEIFSFDFIAGDPSSAMKDAFSLMLTRSAATRYFGEEDPIGQHLSLENTINWTVTAIVEDPPAQTHMPYTMVANIESLRPLESSLFDSWNNLGPNFYFKLLPYADKNAILSSIENIVGQAQSSTTEAIFRFQPLRHIRLGSANIEWEISQVGNLGSVLIFGISALAILALACFNFISLSLALAIRRVQEIGIRKVMGASRIQLIAQLLAESLIMVTAAMLLALLLVELSIPLLNLLSGKTLSLNLFSQYQMIPIVLILIITVSVIAGGYPAWVISRVKAIQAMRNKEQSLMKSNRHSLLRRINIRHILLGVQFAISTALIASSLMIYYQMRHLDKRQPGYVRQNLLVIENPISDSSPARADWFREQLKLQSGVTSVSLSHNIPPNRPNNYASLQFTDESGTRNIHMALISVDPAFFNTLQSRILQGRNFQSEGPSEINHSVIINEAASAMLNVNDPTGLMLEGFYDQQARRVIGMVENIHFSSLHEPAGPTAFIVSPEIYPYYWRNILIRYEEGHAGRLINWITQVWPLEAPQWPLQYYFVDDRYKQDYQDEHRLMYIVASFALLAIIIAAMGLLGISMYAAGTRTREIGIRKVLGAGSASIIRLISKEFMIVILIANLIALPLAWMLVSRWLDNFASRVEVSWLIFAIPALFLTALALLTTGLVALRAAKLNPVESIQHRE